jgi:polyferredoxin
VGHFHDVGRGHSGLHAKLLRTDCRRENVELFPACRGDGLVVLGLFVLASVFIPNFWCRFLCPYGALLGLTSWLSPTRIRRNAETCVDCAECAKACPSALQCGMHWLS